MYLLQRWDMYVCIWEPYQNSEGYETNLKSDWFCMPFLNEPYMKVCASSFILNNDNLQALVKIWQQKFLAQKHTKGHN